MRAKAVVLALVGLLTAPPAESPERHRHAPLSPAAETPRPRSVLPMLDVSAEPLVRGVPRVGVNLGSWHSWGAEQLGANVLQNPGLEGLIDRAVVIVREAWSGGFTDEDTKAARSSGFWTRARFEVLTGPSAGLGGTIADSTPRGRGELPEFRTVGNAPTLKPGDAVALTRVADEEPGVPRWVVPESSAARVRPRVGQVRPGSPGYRSVALAGQDGPAELVYRLDAIGSRAGALLPVEGPWELALWCRAESGTGRLTIRLGRGGAGPLLVQNGECGPAWRELRFPFRARDEGHGVLELRLATQGSSLLVDDLFLGRAAERPDRTTAAARPTKEAFAAIRHRSSLRPSRVLPTRGH